MLCKLKRMKVALESYIAKKYKYIKYRRIDMEPITYKEFRKFLDSDVDEA